MQQSTIYQISPLVLNNENYFHQLVLDMNNSYYWSDDWSEEFYVQLAVAGFISTSHETKDGLILLPELQYDYAVLHFENLHTSKKVQKLMRKENFTFSINKHFNEVLQRISEQHDYNWLKTKYIELLNKLHKKSYQKGEFKVISIELVCKNTQQLIAGEVGYIIGKTYTSLSGFSSREKEYANWGTLQLVMLGKYLEQNGFTLWSLGHPHMEYKQKLGCTTYPRKEFLTLWNDAMKQWLTPLYP